jgi:branched-chain amino acid transport system substrate-binding protein
VTPTSTNPRVTAAGNWYFRVIFDDDFQGAMLAYYAKLALGLTKVALVYVGDDYGKLLESSFSGAARESGIAVPADQLIEEEPDDAAVGRIVAAVAAEPGLQAVLLAMHPRQAERLVPALRRVLPAGVVLIGTDSLASAVPAARDDGSGAGQEGHWSDGMYVPVPFALDTARGEALAFARAYEARTGREPAWQTVYAHDAAKVIVEALRAALPAAGKEDVKALRAAVRDRLAALDAPERSVEGLSGTIFFDAKKGVPRPFVLARAQGGGLFALPRQLQLVGGRGARGRRCDGHRAPRGAGPARRHRPDRHHPRIPRGGRRRRPHLPGRVHGLVPVQRRLRPGRAGLPRRHHADHPRTADRAPGDRQGPLRRLPGARHVPLPGDI